MRLLVRSNAHRNLPGGDGLELASSPDTVGRERWRWHLRLEGSDASPAAPDHAARVEVDLGAGPDEPAGAAEGGHGPGDVLAVDFDPAHIACRVERLAVASRQRLDRHAGQLLALVVASGDVRAEGRHDLRELDLLVLEGDDPLHLDVEPGPAGPAVLGLARVEAADGSQLAWVP